MLGKIIAIINLSIEPSAVAASGGAIPHAGTYAKYIPCSKHTI